MSIPSILLFSTLNLWVKISQILKIIWAWNVCILTNIVCLSSPFFGPFTDHFFGGEFKHIAEEVPIDILCISSAISCAVFLI